MAQEREIDIINENSEYPPEEQIQGKDKIREVLDERDFITPLKDAADEDVDPTEANNSGGAENSAEAEIELALDGGDFPMDNVRPDSGKNFGFEAEDAAAEAHENAAEIVADANGNPVEDEMDLEDAGNDTQELSAKDDSETLTAEDQADADAEDRQLEALPEPEADLSDRRPEPETKKVRRGKSDETAENIFLTLDEDEADADALKTEKLKSKESLPPTAHAKESEKSAAQNSEIDRPPADRRPDQPTPKRAAGPAAPTPVNRPAMLKKMIGFILAAVVVAGYICYNNPALIGFKKVSEPIPAAAGKPAQPARPVAAPLVKPAPPPGPHDKLAAKLEEAAELRRQLLEKMEEIERLNLYYRTGITELEHGISREAHKNGIGSFEQASKNKRIELNLRTIQRRQAYIRGLEKPAAWLNHGSEELLYLMRKAQLDLELIDIAGGVDGDKHNRHISAAINQYRPSADKLALNLRDKEPAPLESLWQQAKNKKNSTTNAAEDISPTAGNAQIAVEICSGNFERMAELASISAETAHCLSRMQGSDLFLNAVTQLSPDAAKELFQWQGNWICLNGIKALSPAVAEYLFKWRGNWISLNGLTEFQPELAVYLLKWEGRQLELMGLKYHKTEPEQKSLKYLALWETTGGRLFVPDAIRKEIGRIMLSQLK